MRFYLRVLILIFLNSFLIYSSKSQGIERPLIVLNKSFIDMDSSIVLSDIPEGDIISKYFLAKEEALETYGRFGENGLLFINTFDPKALYLEEIKKHQLRVGDQKMNFIVNDFLIEQDSLSKINPHDIKKIEVIYPDDAVKIYGIEMINGVVKIDLKDN